MRTNIKENERTKETEDADTREKERGNNVERGESQGSRDTTRAKQSQNSLRQNKNTKHKRPNSLLLRMTDSFSFFFLCERLVVRFFVSMGIYPFQTQRTCLFFEFFYFGDILWLLGDGWHVFHRLSEGSKINVDERFLGWMDGWMDDS